MIALVHVSLEYETFTVPASICIALIEAGAGVTIENSKGQTALHYAATRGGSTVVMQSLLQHEASVDHQSTDGSTALHFAVRAHNKSMMLMLLKAGANHLSKDNNNKTALDIATGPMRRLLLKNCGNVQVASAAAVALAAKAEAEFLAELEAEALVAQQLQPRRKGKRGKKKEQQPQSQPQPKLKTKTAVIVKQKATTAPVKLIQPVVPRVLCEIAVKLNHTELLSQGQ